MTNRSKLAEVLGLEENEEFTIKGEQEGERSTYRIHNGRRECKDDSNVWCACGYEPTLTKLINDPTLIQTKPRFTDEEMTVLRWLHKHAQLKRLCKDKFGVTDVRLGNVGALGSNIAYCLLKPGEEINLDEMFGSITDGK